MYEGFIKWMIDYTKGFSIRDSNWGSIKRYIVYINTPTFNCAVDKLSIENWPLYPLILQQVIEGINTLEDFEIIQTRSNVVVYSEYPVQEFEIEPGKEYEAKEQALQYIYEMCTGD